MIDLHHVTKVFNTKAGPHVVLDDVSVSFPRDRSIGILGRNGAGKSTLLRILGRALTPDLGRVVHHGRVSWPIGFKGAFSGNLSAADNCRFVARIYDEDPERVIEETREFSEIGEHFYLPMSTYSSGMKARVGFGLTMAIDFDAFLVDEAIAVGDKRFRRKCLEAFEARREYARVIIVSHEPATIQNYCDTCAVLHDGGLTLFSDLEAAQDMYESVAA